jgi:hypothetical protein
MHPTPVDIPLEQLPRKTRLWLCEQIGWKKPQHFGIVSLFPNGAIYAGLQERLRAEHFNLRERNPGVSL